MNRISGRQERNRVERDGKAARRGGGGTKSRWLREREKGDSFDSVSRYNRVKLHGVILSVASPLHHEGVTFAQYEGRVLPSLTGL